MGKVSHDIGNLAASLYANISYSELALEGLHEHVAGDGARETAELYAESLQGMLADLKQSVDRIVGYSRLVSDLSAGRELRPSKKVAPMADTIRTAAAFLASEGRKDSVALRYEVQDDAPPTLHDELYLFRIVQNLVGNAIKAVRETIPEDWQARFGEEDEAVFGEVTIRYCFADGSHVVEVVDTGAGMTKETADRILSGNASSQWVRGGGSGWGMRIVLELAATHDAKVEVDSELGRGSTIRVVFPHAG
jgi:signal transduction histidine kinase